MVQPGGHSDKFGNRYEDKWTLWNVLRLFAEEIQSLNYEIPREEFEGFEFSLETVNGEVQYWQVKRQQSLTYRWTISNLEKHSVLQDFFEHHGENPQDKLIFASTQPSEPLRELVKDAAECSNSLQEFEQLYANGTTRHNWFEKLVDCVADLASQGSDVSRREAKEITFNFLPKVDIRPRSKESLIEENKSLARTHIDANPQTTLDALGTFIEENVGQHLTPTDVWDFVGEHPNLRPRAFERDKRLQPTFRQYLEDFESWYDERSRLLDEVIQRPEAEEVLTALDEEADCVFVTGEAGAGKSHVLLDVCSRLRDRNTTVLPMRADKFDQRANTPRQLLQNTDLPNESPPRLLATLAGVRTQETDARHAVLLLDQLDHASKYRGKNPEILQPIRRLIESAANDYPKIQVVVACRKVDLKYDDNSFRALRKDLAETAQVSVGPLKSETVRKIVNEIGYDGGALSPAQLELLGNPLHLWMLSEIGRDEETRHLDLSTKASLFDRFEDYKERKYHEHGPDQRWPEVMKELVEELKDEPSLRVSERRIRHLLPEIRVLSSEHVLVEDADGCFSFFHEEYFDHVFASHFLRRDDSLVEFLEARVQHLIRRNQTRQILQYLRSSATPRDRTEYRKTLEGLLESSVIRPHIKKVVFAFLQGVPKPREHEFELLTSLRNHGGPFLAREARRTLVRPNWFEKTLETGLLKDWLDSNIDNAQDGLVSAVRNGFDNRPEAALDFLMSEIVENGHQQIAAKVLEGVDLSTNRAAFELCCELYVQGVFDDLVEPELLFHDLEEKKPAWAAEAFGLTLCRHAQAFVLASLDLEIDEIDNREAPFEFTVRPDEMNVLVEEAPAVFARHVLPVILLLASRFRYVEDDRPKRDGIWSLLQTMGTVYNPAQHLLDALSDAFTKLGAESPEELRKFITVLQNHDHLEISQYLLLEAFSSVEEEFNTEAVELLERRMQLDSGVQTLDGFHTLRSLVKQLSAHLPRDEWLSFEQNLLRHVPRIEIELAKDDKGSTPRICKMDTFSEREKQHVILHNSIGKERYLLLDASVPEARASQIQRELKALARKIPYAKDPVHIGRGGVTGGGKVDHGDENEGLAMSDEDWTRRIDRFVDRSGEEKHPFAKSELQGTLRKAARRNPNRFLALLSAEFDASVPEAFFGAIFNGVSTSIDDREEVERGNGERGDHESSQTEEDEWEEIPGVDKHQVWDAIRKTYDTAGIDCASRICKVLTKLEASSPPEDIVEIISEWALDHRNPQSESWKEIDDETDPSNKWRTISLNSASGRAIKVIAKWTFDSEVFFRDNQALLSALLEAEAPPDQIRTIEVLLAALRWEFEWAVSRFVDLVEGAPDPVLATTPSNRCLRQLGDYSLDRLYPLVRRMVESEYQQVQQLGANHACIFQFRDYEQFGFSDLADVCLGEKATVAQQKGAAAAYVQLLNDHPDVCDEQIGQLLDADEEKVRSEAQSCFHTLRESGDLLANHQSLVEAFVNSRSAWEQPRQFLRAVEASASTIDQEPLEWCHELFRRGNEKTENSRIGFRIGDKLTDIAQRVLNDHTAPEQLHEKALDLIDEMIVADVWRVNSKLE